MLGSGGGVQGGSVHASGKAGVTVAVTVRVRSPHVTPSCSCCLAAAAAVAVAAAAAPAQLAPTPRITHQACQPLPACRHTSPDQVPCECASRAAVLVGRRWPRVHVISPPLPARQPLLARCAALHAALTAYGYPLPITGTHCHLGEFKPSWNMPLSPRRRCQARPGHTFASSCLFVTARMEHPTPNSCTKAAHQQLHGLLATHGHAA
eukprot:366575-Chlamydomonas_euryale.AAC.5